MIIWTGETRPAAPGWRAALREVTIDNKRRSIVEVASWGVPRPNGDLVPLDQCGRRLDGPGLLYVAPPGMGDAEVWAMLAASSRVAAAMGEKMMREEAA